MSIFDRVRSAFTGSLHVPLIDALGNQGHPVALVGESQSFTGFDDPNFAEFVRDGQKTSTGATVTQKSLLRNSSSFRAISLISSALGMLPLSLYQKVMISHKQTDKESGETTTTSSMSAKRAEDHPVHRLMSKRPNSFQTPFEFKSFMVFQALVHGTAYAVKKRRVRARAKGGMIIDELIPIRAQLVEPKMSRDFILFFRYHDPDGPPIDIPTSDMFWFRQPVSEDGVTGVKLLDVARETVGLSMQSEQASGRVLKNGALVGGVLQHPKALSEPAIERLRTQFEERQSGPENAGKWIVAEDGMEVAPFGHTLKDSQNAELRKFQIEEMARFTGVPRPLLMLDETSWGTGIEQLGLFLITYCLLPWFVSIEQAVARSLLSEEEQEDYYAKFNEGALLRGSLKDQSEFFARALGSGGGRGWMTQNEVRDKFELEPKDEGDELPEPITKAPASEGDKPDEKDDGAPDPSKQKGK